MAETFEVLNGQYVVLPEHRSGSAFIGEVRHVHRNGTRRIFTPVAHVSAFAHRGADMVRPHWSIHLFVRSDIRYQEDEGTTTVVSNPERQAGSNVPFLNRLVALRNSKLPCVHARLPEALGAMLVAASVLSEPAVVHVYASLEQSLVEFGDVYHDEDA